MTRTLEDLKVLVGFLNNEPVRIVHAPVGEFALLRDWYHSTRLKAAYNTLRYALTDLLAPTVAIPRTWKSAMRKKQTAFMSYYRPKVGLKVLLDELNKHAEKPRWRGIPTTKQFARISVPGFTGAIVKREFSNLVWQTIANLLESGDIFLIGLCSICETFFVKNRDWQKCCPKASCRKTHEHRLAADRQARVRRKRKAKLTAVYDIRPHGQKVHHDRGRQTSRDQPRGTNLKALRELQKKAKAKPK